MAIPAGLIQGIERLDPLPITLQRLVGTLDDERVGPAQVGDILQYDPAASSNILRTANSAASGFRVQADSIRDAVIRLGKARVFDIVMGRHMRTLKIEAPMYALTEDELWLHSAAASLAARALAQERPRAGIPESASIAALVHDIGKLLMVRYLNADVTTILALRDERRITFVDAERELFGCDHAEVGGEMARRWGFPEEIQRAIAHHHDATPPDNSPTQDAVVVANVVAKVVGTGLGAEGMDIRFDTSSHARLGLDFAGLSSVVLQTLTWLNELKADSGLKAA